ncbi:hypothetical protein [Luteolibacter luteus]|uniref:Transmembrane protein n=1 Tax=Luteolibacter luteus TaxID=2728835 RepID=A0A858RFS3_9BACT|nr:hypothetical protein [Luteolibacter luteus]QJE95602.1 hypothetical protein HHL09_07305 [Luteolibacter luteus]
MSQRPKFWIHRSGRFWKGFGIFLFLFGTWIITMFSTSHVDYSKYSASSSVSASLTLNNGGLGFRSERSTSKTPSSGSRHSNWDIDTSRANGASLNPVFEWKTHDYQLFSVKILRIFLPLWLPLVGWTAFWFYHMHRQDKREEKFYANQQAEVDSPPPLADP